MTEIGRRSQTVLCLLTAFALVACSATPTPSPSPIAPGGEGLIAQLTAEPFSEASVDAAVAILAANGVGTYDTAEATTSIVPVAEPAVPFKLLLDQVRIMAFEANGQPGGIGGSEIDALIETEDDLAPPSYILAGYVAAADTTGSLAAKQIMRAQDWGVDEWREAPYVVFPQLVMVLFMADVVRERATEETAEAALLAGVGQLPRSQALLAIADDPVAQTGPCSAVANFISGALKTVFDALRLGEPKRGVFAVLTRIWNYVVSILEAVVRGIVKTFTDRVLHAIGRAAAIVGTVSTIISLVKPWKTSMYPLPITTEKGIDGIRPVEHGNLIVRVEVPGPQEWPGWALDCARQAGRSLPSLRPEGANVTWGLIRQQPPDLITVDQAEPKLDSDGRAQVNFTTLVDYVDEPYITLTGTIWGQVTVERPGLQDLLDVAKRELWSEIPSVVVGPLQAFLGPYIANIETNLRSLVSVTRSGGGFVRYHVQQEGTPDPAPASCQLPSGPPATAVVGASSLGQVRAVSQSEASCGTSAGDPHIVTIDGSEYDFQAAGEYVLMRSADGTFELQARQVPWPGHSNISFNTAIALRLGASQLVMVEEVAEETVTITVDGSPFLASEPVRIGNAEVIAEAEGFIAAFDDGSVVYGIGGVGDGINVLLDPSQALFESGGGVMARVPDGSMGVPALPDGTSLPPTDDADAYHQALYVTFADAWRITPETSLFDYAPGTSTQTYVVPGFPTTVVTLVDLTPEQRAAGDAACGLVNGDVLREMCIFDAGITNNLGFGELYSTTETVAETGEISASGTVEETRPPR